MTLLRRVLGETLRGQRLRQRRTLREVSGAARVSLGYLSEVERGQKEASSELLASICEALDVRMSDLLREVSDQMRRTERTVEVAGLPARTLVPAGVAGPVRRPLPHPGDRGGLGLDGFDPAAFEATGFDAAGFDAAGVDGASADVRAADAGREQAGREVAALDVPTADFDLDLAGLDAPAAPARDAAALDDVGLTAPAAPGLDPARLERFGIDIAELDGVDLAELETGDGLGEVEALLGLTDLACLPEGFGQGPMNSRLAGAGAAA